MNATLCKRRGQIKHLVEFIRRELSSTDFEEVDAIGTFVNEENNKNKTITPGSVYGFFVSLTENEKNILFEEAKIKGTLRLKNISSIKPVKDEIYVLYWGKDKSLGSRINAHINNPTGKTGLARLSAYKSLHNKTITCVALVVNNNSGFEAHLQREYPDILKTNSAKL